MKNAFYAILLMAAFALVMIIVSARVNAVYGTKFDDEKGDEVLVLEPEEKVERNGKTEEKMPIVDCNEEKVLCYTEADAEMIAKTLWGECRGVDSRMEQAAVAWCILNRVDDSFFEYTIKDVIAAPFQFAGYKESNPVSTPLLELARDVLERWQMEKNGVSDVGRVLPKDFTYFCGDGERNYFYNDWYGADSWDWSCRNPYDN